MTLSLVQTVTVGSGGAASIDFTSIPQTGTDLLIVYSLRGDSGTQNADFNFNNQSMGTNQTIRVLSGTGSAASSYSDTYSALQVQGSTTTASTFGSISVYVPNYSGSTNKSFSVDLVTENNATAAVQRLYAGLWSSTAAITSAKITSTAGNFAQYSTASLYTITKGSGGATVS